MGRIRVLDPHVVNQIAAGEVIERPASVVKELVENALDAGARRVDVTVEDGGRALIEVADDGWGMEPDDLRRAFLPHATSKVSCVDDLQHVSSLGFRGEALASIGSVARVRILSRVRDAESGASIEDDHGDVGDVRPAAASPGTVVRVEGLFGRVPARRKFLRTAPTELGHISALMGRFALAFPEVSFRLAQGTRVILDARASPATDGGDRRERIGAVHGDEVARALLRVDDRSADLELEAWVGPPSLHRGDARLEQVFIAGRHVRDKTVAHAIRQAYADLLPPGGRRPIAFLFLRCDPARVDVNVHPAKAEVRWRDAQPVHRLVSRALRSALEGAAPGVPVSLDPLRPVPSSTVDAVEFAFTHGVGRAPGAAAPATSPIVRDAQGPTSLSASTPEAAPARDAEPARVQTLRPVGQALGTYQILEADDALVLVDQHALHERVLHEKITTRLREAGALEMQRLLVPVVVHFDPADAARLVEERELVRSLGWEVEPFGEDALAIHGHPAVLKRPDPERVLQELVRGLDEGAKEGLDGARLLAEAVERLACRAAVMSGDVLHPDEVLALLEEAEALDHAHSCPHGRPTRLTLSRAQLERWFHRTV